MGWTNPMTGRRVRTDGECALACQCNDLVHEWLHSLSTCSIVVAPHSPAHPASSAPAGAGGGSTFARRLPGALAPMVDGSLGELSEQFSPSSGFRPGITMTVVCALITRVSSGPSVSTGILAVPLRGSCPCPSPSDKPDDCAEMVPVLPMSSPGSRVDRLDWRLPPPSSASWRVCSMCPPCSNGNLRPQTHTRKHARLACRAQQKLPVGLI